MKRILTCFLILFVTLNVTSQVVIEWQKCYGGSSGFQEGRSIQITADGGYILAGFTYSNDGDVSGNHGETDYWIVKTDKDGTIQWQKCLGGSYGDTANFVIQTNDGGYIVTGFVWSNDGDVTGWHGSIDYWVVKLDGYGNIQWQKALGGSNDEYSTSVSETSDGGYIIAGSSLSINGDITFNHGNSDYWIVKLDSAGNIQWQKSYGGSLPDQATSVKQTLDGGYIIAGYTFSIDGDVTGPLGGGDYWIVKIDNIGNIQWQKCYGGTEKDEATSIVQTNDGGYVVAGKTHSDDGDVTGNHSPGWLYSDIWIVKIDSVGNLQWQKCLGGSINSTNPG